MAERRSNRHVKMAYSFDRLADIKISQVYKLLVPEEIKNCRKDNSSIKKIGDIEIENGSNLCKGIIGEAKRRANHR